MALAARDSLDAAWRHIRSRLDKASGCYELETREENGPPVCRFQVYRGIGDLSEGMDLLVVILAVPKVIPEGVKMIVFVDCEFTGLPPLPVSLISVVYDNCRGLLEIKALPLSLEKLTLLEYPAHENTSEDHELWDYGVDYHKLYVSGALTLSREQRQWADYIVPADDEGAMINLANELAESAEAKE